MDIHVYDVIDGATARAVKAALIGSAPVTVHINSPGGSVTDALAIYSNLRNYKGHVTAIVDGLCASAATIIMLAADEIVVAEHSLLMIHNPWTVASGDAVVMRKTAETLDKASVEMAALYAERTGLDAEAVTAIMEVETWYNAHEAVDAGFAHRVDGSDREKPRMAASAMTYLAGVVQFPEAAAQCRQRMIDLKTEARARQISAILQPGIVEIPAVSNLIESTDIMSKTPEQIRAAVMAALGEDTTPSAPPTKPGTFIHAGNGNIIRDGMTDALAARLNIAKPQDKGSPYLTMSLMDMARASLTERGVGIAGMGSKMQVVGAAFTHSTSDFSHVLMDVSQKAMLAGWQGSGETFPLWTKKGTLSNFHTAHRAGIAGFPQLPKVAEGAEYKYVSTDDHGAPITLATYGGLFSITRQAIINDDLSAFSTIPANLGRAASRTIGDLVYSVLTTNGNFVDGKTLFHADHGNIVTGAAPLSPAILGEARHKMRLQTDGKGNSLNIAPAFVIVPAALESAALQVINSTSVPGAETNSGIMNPVNNMGALIVESRLDAASASTWYVAAAQGSDTIEVAYLDGADTPYIEQQEGWTVDGVSYKVRIDAGVAALDYRGVVKGTST